MLISNSLPYDNRQYTRYSYTPTFSYLLAYNDIDKYVFIYTSLWAIYVEYIDIYCEKRLTTTCTCICRDKYRYNQFIFTPLIVFLCVKPLCRPGGGYSPVVVVVCLMGTELFVSRVLLS